MTLAQGSSAELQAVIIGDSAIREAVLSEDALGDELSSLVGSRVKARVLAAGGLTHYDALAVTDLIHGHVRGVIAAEISPYNLAMRGALLEDVLGGRLGFRSEALEQELKDLGFKPPARFRNYFLDNYRFFVARPTTAWGMFGTPVTMQLHLQGGARPWTTAQWKQNHKRVYGWEAHYHANKKANLKVYRRMVDLTQRGQGVRFVLLETVLNPLDSVVWASSRGDRVVRACYTADVQQFATENQLLLVDAAADAGLKPEEFLDYTHVRSDDARRRYTHALALRLAPTLVSIREATP